MKVCFIGMCGHSRQAYRVLRSRADVELCGVAPGSAHENMTESFDPEIPFFASWQEMLDSVAPELAIVSPVFGLTARIVIECAERGIDVFSEKPVAASLEELDRLEHAIKKSGIRFSAMHYLRFLPEFWHAASLVRGGAIGEVKLINAQKSYRFGTRPEWYNDRNLFTGIIPWVGIHAIDWIYAFSRKKFLSVSAMSFGSPERTALCQFALEDDVVASATLDYYRPKEASTHGDDRVRCVGSDGVIEVAHGRIRLINGDGEQWIEPTAAPEPLDSFLNGEDIITADEILYLTKVALLARESADNDGIKTVIEVK